MADTEMQEQHVPSGAEAVHIDTKSLEEEKSQTPSDTLQPLIPVDKNESGGANEDVDLQVNGHAKNGDVGASEIPQHLVPVDNKESGGANEDVDVQSNGDAENGDVGASEIPQPLVPVDNKESGGANEDVDVQSNGDAKNGDVGASEIPQPLVYLDNKESGGANEDVDVQANSRTKNGDVGASHQPKNKTPSKVELSTPKTGDANPKKRKTWLLRDSEAGDIDEAGTPEEQAAFLRELVTFHKENFLEFKALKFYGQPLNILKLWRAVIRLGGYEVVTTSKTWRLVGESFNPPKTCTTVSYTFRLFYEKALLEYENYLRKNGELNLASSTVMPSSSVKKEASGHQGLASGRARRDSAVRAMQNWNARLNGSGEVSEPIVKDKSSNSIPKQKKLKSIGLPKHETQISVDLVVPHEADKQSLAEVVDVGPLADWVRINVKETTDSFEIFALIPGLLRNEVRVQSDPSGKLVITGQPEQLDNPWGITPFKKIVNLSTRIDPLRTSAVMSMHGRFFIRVPFEQ